MSKLFFSFGQSLLEAVVALGVIMVILVGLVRAGVVGIRNSSSSQSQALSGRYASEAIEWLRNQQQVMGWQQFSIYFSFEGDVYCLSSSTLAVSASGFSTTLGALNPVFCANISSTNIKRRLLVNSVGIPTTIDVEMTWYEGTNLRTTTYQGQFSPVTDP